MGLLVEVLTDTAVNVSWGSVTVPGIVSYTVYYRPAVTVGGQGEQSVTVPSSESSVVIEGLMTGVQYQFQVAAIAEVDGVAIHPLYWWYCRLHAVPPQQIQVANYR